MQTSSQFQVFSALSQVDFKFYVKMQQLFISNKFYFYFFQSHLLLMHSCLNSLAFTFGMKSDSSARPPCLDTDLRGINIIKIAAFFKKYFLSELREFSFSHCFLHFLHNECMCFKKCFLHV